ncbi:alpha/beta-hydrolase [Lentinus brumalis]|uniref:Alpha/beta-hydrolase n=1 Tax=Lentinus brumalis TaxID=2498619 RepID=A0A371DBY4_9APHY|nr:alpha/beta-hydrolase [Polyporus brumalis]
MRALSAILLLAAIKLATAAPTPLFGIDFGDININTDGETSDADTAALSQEDITNTLVRPALFARVAYCSSPAVLNMTCGEQCDALPNVKILVAGGDDGLVPNFFVAHDVDTDTIVVAHQGTDPKNLLSDLNDLNFFQVDANTTILPKANEDVKMHDGFAYTQERTADVVLSTVQSALESTGAKKVLVTGHSLGAAIASIDGMMLRMKLDPSIAVTTTVFGLPRVGNKAWADLVDSTLGTSFTHVTNQHDPVPQVPPQFVDFQHPSNEIHITGVDSGGNTATAQRCPGQENQNCSPGNSLLDLSIDNHRGPYFQNISMGNKFCPV